MTLLETRALEVFVKAAELESFSEAGRALDISQPAVSQQIRGLEEHLDTKLFNRRKSGLSLTKAGETLLPEAQAIIASVIDVERRIRRLNEEVSGDLVIACAASAASYLLPHIVTRFQQEFPDIHVSTQNVDRERVLPGLVEGIYDLGIVDTHSSAPDDVTYTYLFTDHLALIAPAEHPWAGLESLPPTQMPDERYICREADSACRRVVTQALAEHGVDTHDFKIVMEVANAEALAMAVEHGLGLSFVSWLAAMPRIRLGKLAAIDIENVRLEYPVEIIALQQPLSARARAFLDFIQTPDVYDLIEDLTQPEVMVV